MFPPMFAQSVQIWQDCATRMLWAAAMKRDLGLLREILLYVEAQGDEPAFTAEIEIESYSREQIAYHGWLALDAGFIDGSDASDTGGRAAYATQENGYRILHRLRT